MQCSRCYFLDSRVIESRSADGGKSIRRRRECLKCKHRFTTYERIEYLPIAVIKRDLRREFFDRAKLLMGIVRACEKTGIEREVLEAIADEIELQLQNDRHREVSSQEIGEIVLARLQPLSEVAYIRFASVYRQFQGIADFVETLDQLQCSSPDDRRTSIQSPHPSLSRRTIKHLCEEKGV